VKHLAATIRLVVFIQDYFSKTQSQKENMLIKYFIKIVIPLVFASLVAAFGWFANETTGAVIAGISGLALSASWTCYSWMTASKALAVSKPSARRRNAIPRRALKVSCG
jgi:hypothetical protein